MIKRMLAVAVIWLAALALPLVLWLLYLAASAAGLMHKQVVPAQAWLDGLRDWLASAWFIVSWLHGCLIGMTVAKAYFWIAALFLFFASFLSANANSLHRLYRDKLSKAFLFNPFPRTPPKGDDDDLEALDDWKLEQNLAAQRRAVSPDQHGGESANSKHANRRDCNAAFSPSSSLYIGGEATGYVATGTISKADPNINLGTAMAISGAAVSSNMGSSSIQALAPTLALLNVRLGYWMINPRFAVGSGFFLSIADGIRRLFAKVPDWSGPGIRYKGCASSPARSGATGLPTYGASSPTFSKDICSRRCSACSTSRSPMSISPMAVTSRIWASMRF